jgi:3-hydroxyacyl-CoA dehydrogenase
MHYANTLGLAEVLTRIRNYQQGYQGSQWQPDPLLVSLAGQAQSFGG